LADELAAGEAHEDAAVSKEAEKVRARKMIREPGSLGIAFDLLPAPMSSLALIGSDFRPWLIREQRKQPVLDRFAKVFAT
jgi:hypothetical protein